MSLCDFLRKEKGETKWQKCQNREKLPKQFCFIQIFPFFFVVFREQNIGNETVKKKTPWGWHFLFLTKNTSFFSLLWNFFHFFLWLFIFFFSTEALNASHASHGCENIDLLFFFTFNANKNIEVAKKVFFSSAEQLLFFSLNRAY